MSKRIQLRRTKGWRKPDNTVVVSRPSHWGNPIHIERRDDYEGLWLVVDRQGTVLDHRATKSEAAALAVKLFREWVTTKPSSAWWEQTVRQLRGKNLACWCPLDQPCHADILLELANREESDG